MWQYGSGTLNNSDLNDIDRCFFSTVQIRERSREARLRARVLSRFTRTNFALKVIYI